MSASRIGWLVMAVLVAVSLVVAQRDDSTVSTNADRVLTLSQQIKCPTCPGQSVAESEVPIAREIRTRIASEVDAGRTDEQIRAGLVLSYGDEVLLTPRSDGFNAVVWVLPVVVVVAAVGGLVVLFRRWQASVSASATPADRAVVDQALAARRGAEATDQWQDRVSNRTDSRHG